MNLIGKIDSFPELGNTIVIGGEIYVKKQELLSDEAVCQILLKKEWRGFVELVRIIEKAHGIGGDDE